MLREPQIVYFALSVLSSTLSLLEDGNTRILVYISLNKVRANSRNVIWVFISQKPKQSQPPKRSVSLYQKISQAVNNVQQYLVCFKYVIATNL